MISKEQKTAGRRPGAVQRPQGTLWADRSLLRTPPCRSHIRNAPPTRAAAAQMGASDNGRGGLAGDVHRRSTLQLAPVHGEFRGPGASGVAPWLLWLLSGTARAR